MHRESEQGLDLITVPAADLAEVILTVTPQPGERWGGFAERLARHLATREAEILQLTVVGPVAAHAEGAVALETALGGLACPVTWVEGALCTGGPIAGIHAHAVSGVEVQTLSLGGKIIGRAYQHGTATVCHVGALTPDPSLPPGEQATQAFLDLESVLGQVGMGMSNVARTWLYLDTILSWYDDLNRSRTKFFNERKVFDGLVPASTGIAGKNPTGSAIAMQAFAVKSDDAAVRVEALPSPLQCPALDYGSSFNRAVEIALPGSRRISVSGTASIDAAGESIHLGDVDNQIGFTLEVVNAILESRQMSFADVTRAYVYFKHAEDAPAWERHREAQCLALPTIVAAMDVCRDDLLFEMEVDAVVPA